MANVKEVFLLFTCDEWKSKSSMNLVGIFLSEKKARIAIKSLIKNDVVGLEGYSISDVDDWEFDEIDNYVDYLYLYRGYNEECELDGGYLV